MPIGHFSTLYVSKNTKPGESWRTVKGSVLVAAAAAAAAKSLQSCPTLRDPIDSSPPGSPVPGILQARTLEWVAISFSNAWKWKVKVKSLCHVQLLATPWTAAYQAPLSMGFARQEYWSGFSLPSPISVALDCKCYVLWFPGDTIPSTDTTYPSFLVSPLMVCLKSGLFINGFPYMYSFRLIYIQCNGVLDRVLFILVSVNENITQISLGISEDLLVL